MSGNLPPSLQVQANGQAVLNDAYLNTMVQGGCVVANLRGFIAVSNMVVLTVGQTAPGDGLARMYYWSATSTAADDGLNVIAPNGLLAGRWLAFGAAAPGNQATAGVFTNTQMNQPYTFALGGINFQTEYQAEQSAVNYSTDALAGGVAVPSTSTVWGANAVAGYATGTSIHTNTVAVYGQYRARAAGVNGWGANFVADNGGFSVANLQGIEVDLSVSGPGGGVVSAVSVVSAFTSAPTASFAFACQAHNLPFTWAFNSQDAAAGTGLLVGALATTANSDSQPIALNTHDASNNNRFVAIQGLHQAGSAILSLDPGAGGYTSSAGPVLLPLLTVATLPAPSSANGGAIAIVIDSTSPTYNAPLTGGGSFVVIAMCDGAVWRAH